MPTLLQQKGQTTLLVLGLTLMSAGLVAEEVTISMPGALSSVLTGSGGLLARDLTPATAINQYEINSQFQDHLQRTK